jgi:hypothetical protein
MQLPGAGRYCAQCGDWFDFIEGNEGREYCSNYCEETAGECPHYYHTWVHTGQLNVICTECSVRGIVRLLD